MPGRGGGELGDEVVVDQEALDQGAEVGVAHRQQQLAEPGGQLADVLRALRQEVGGLDAGGVEDSMCERMTCSDPWKIWALPRTLEVVARLERPGQLLGGVPEPGADGAGLVAEVEVQVQVALAVGPELLVGDEVDLVDRVAVGQLVDVAASHAIGSTRWTWIGIKKAVAGKPRHGVDSRSPRSARSSQAIGPTSSAFAQTMPIGTPSGGFGNGWSLTVLTTPLDGNPLPLPVWTSCGSSRRLAGWFGRLSVL